MLRQGEDFDRQYAHELGKADGSTAVSTDAARPDGKIPPNGDATPLETGLTAMCTLCAIHCEPRCRDGLPGVPGAL